jgi:hypothetical protein
VLPLDANICNCAGKESGGGRDAVAQSKTGQTPGQTHWPSPKGGPTCCTCL